MYGAQTLSNFKDWKFSVSVSAGGQMRIRIAWDYSATLSISYVTPGAGESSSIEAGPISGQIAHSNSTFTRPITTRDSSGSLFTSNQAEVEVVCQLDSVKKPGGITRPECGRLDAWFASPLIRQRLANWLAKRSGVSVVEPGQFFFSNLAGH